MRSVRPQQGPRPHLSHTSAPPTQSLPIPVSWSPRPARLPHLGPSSTLFMPEDQCPALRLADDTAMRPHGGITLQPASQPASTLLLTEPAASAQACTRVSPQYPHGVSLLLPHNAKEATLEPSNHQERLSPKQEEGLEEGSIIATGSSATQRGMEASFPDGGL